MTSWWDMVASMIRLSTALGGYISDWPRLSGAELSLTAIDPAKSCEELESSSIGTVESLTRISRLQEQSSRPHIYRQHCLPQKGLLRAWLRVWPLEHGKSYYAGWIWKWTCMIHLRSAAAALGGWRLWLDHGISKKESRTRERWK